MGRGGGRESGRPVSGCRTDRCGETWLLLFDAPAHFLMQARRPTCVLTSLNPPHTSTPTLHVHFCLLFQARWQTCLPTSRALAAGCSHPQAAPPQVGWWMVRCSRIFKSSRVFTSAGSS